MASLKTRLGRLKSLGLRRASELGQAPAEEERKPRDRKPLPGWTALGPGSRAL